MDKPEKLKKILKKMESLLVAYSGGTDSTFLLKVAADVLGDKVLAVTADSATYPPQELSLARKTANTLGVRHKVIMTRELEERRFRSNPVNRCYFCKRELFRRLKKIARDNKLNFVADAGNLSDDLDFRPGNQAKAELGIRSPLQEAGLTKKEIRRFSKKMGLDTWDKPSLACLASRIPYGSGISRSVLKRIDLAEIFLRRLGIQQVRVRHYDSICRIETQAIDMPKLIDKRNLIVEKLKGLGYNYVTVDLEGYRTGSMNEAIKRLKRSGE